MATPNDTSGGETDWELLNEFARQRDQLDPFLLRGLLANTLRSRGFGHIVWSEDGVEQKAPKNRVATVVSLMVIWGFGVCATRELGLPWFVAPLGALAAAAGLGALAKLSGESAGVGALVVLGWIVVGLVEAIEGTFLTLVVGYLLPLGLGIVYALATRLLRLRDAQDVAAALAGVIKSAPLVAPVVLIVLFLPALSADVWRIAGQLTFGSLLIVGVLSVGLLFVVVRLQLGSEVEPMIAQRSEHLSDLGTRSDLTRNQVAAIAEEDGAALLEGITDSTLDSVWPVAGEEYAPYLQTAVGDTLQAPLTGRLAVTVGAIGLLFSGYIYLLCAAVVPVDTAAHWSGVSTPSTDVSILGVTVSLVGGPFLKLAALLGLAATATFLSFALVEARFATALTNALLRDPTDRFLVLALPYVRLWEHAIELGWRLPVETDPGPPPPAPAG